MLLKLAILISGRGSNMQAILKAIKKQSIPINPVVVISNKPSARGLRIELAKQILERNSPTAKETLDIMGFEIIDNEPKLVDDKLW